VADHYRSPQTRQPANKARDGNHEHREDGGLAEAPACKRPHLKKCRGQAENRI